MRVNRKKFLASLLKSQKITSRLPYSSEVLKHIKLEPCEGGLKITSTNLEILLEEIVPGEGKVKSVCVPIKSVLPVVRDTVSEELQIETEKDRFSITTPTGKYKFSTLNVKDFPNTDAFKGSEFYEEEVPEIRDILFSLSHIPPQEGSLPEGVLIESVEEPVLTEKEGDLRVVATDERRLMLTTVSMPLRKDRNIKVILPGETGRILREEGGAIPYVRFGKKTVSFSNTSTTITVRTIDREYPNYVRVVKFERPEASVEVSRALLNSTLMRIIGTYGKDIPAVKMRIQEGEMLLAGRSSLFEVEERVPVCGRMDGEILVNASYLYSVTSRMKDEEFEISWKTSICYIKGRNTLGLVAGMRE
jgi:DNA polymerase III sliding clamp (beta) subunit (PCNA family)